MMFCSRCGQEVEAGVMKCPNCGDFIQRPRKSTKYCQSCGAEVSVGAMECHVCGELLGYQQPQIVINNSNTSANVNTNANMNVNGVVRARGRRVHWLTSFLLCLFLGFLGAHKFYEGKIGMGILYACTCGLCGIGWLIDLVTLLFKPKPYYYV